MIYFGLSSFKYVTTNLLLWVQYKHAKSKKSAKNYHKKETRYFLPYYSHLQDNNRILFQDRLSVNSTSTVYSSPWQYRTFQPDAYNHILRHKNVPYNNTIWIWQTCNRRYYTLYHSKLKSMQLLNNINKFNYVFFSTLPYHAWPHWTKHSTLSALINIPSTIVQLSK